LEFESVGGRGESAYGKGGGNAVRNKVMNMLRGFYDSIPLFLLSARKRGSERKDGESSNAEVVGGLGRGEDRKGIVEAQVAEIVNRRDYIEKKLDLLMRDCPVVEKVDVWFSKIKDYIPDVREEELNYCKEYIRRHAFRKWGDSSQVVERIEGSYAMEVRMKRKDGALSSSMREAIIMGVSTFVVLWVLLFVSLLVSNEGNRWVGFWSKVTVVLFLTFSISVFVWLWGYLIFRYGAKLMAGSMGVIGIVVIFSSFGAGGEVYRAIIRTFGVDVGVFASGVTVLGFALFLWTERDRLFGEGKKNKGKNEGEE